MKNTGTQGTVYKPTEKAVVMIFHPTTRFGYAQTGSGETIHFHMARSRYFIPSADGPVFDTEQKDEFPVEGDILSFCRDTKPVKADKHPTMFLWNFERAYQTCLTNCSATVTPAVVEQIQRPKFPEKVASSAKSHANRHKQKRYHNSPRISDRREDGGARELKGPGINLLKELEELARGAGGKNGNTRRHHQLALTQSTH